MITCIVIPDFAAAAHDALAKPLPGAPVILVRYGVQRGIVAAYSSEAETYGIQVGMTLSRVRALCPTAQIVTLDPSLLNGALEHLFQFLWTFTNRIELDEASYPQKFVCYLDIGNLNEEGTLFLGQQIITQAYTQLAVTPSLGIAGGKFSAYVAAIVTNPGALQLIPLGEEPVFVGPRSVQLLPLGKEIRRRLEIFHIATIGQFAALPPMSILSQFGKEGRLLHQLARGLDSRPVVPKRMPPVESALRRFEYALKNTLYLDGVIEEIAGELAERLDARISAVHEIHLSLTFEDGTCRTEQLHLLQPLASAGAIAQTLYQLARRAVLTQGVEYIEVSLMHLVPNIPRQMELFTHKPARQQLIDLAQVLSECYGSQLFYEAQRVEHSSLVPEQRFRLLRLGAS